MIRIGIIGAGRIGKVHLESITYHVKNAVVKAMADPFMNEETEKFIRGMGVEKIYKDYKAILADPEIDAVLVCSSTDTHASISIEAIEAGKNVFCEKPVDHALDKIKAVEDALAPIRNVSSRLDSTAVSTITLRRCAKHTMKGKSAKPIS